MNSPWESDALAHCKWCIKDVDVLNMGKSTLKSHMKGKNLSITLPQITVNH